MQRDEQDADPDEALGDVANDDRQRATAPPPEGDLEDEQDAAPRERREEQERRRERHGPLTCAPVGQRARQVQRGDRHRAEDEEQERLPDEAPRRTCREKEPEREHEDSGRDPETSRHPADRPDPHVKPASPKRVVQWKRV